MDIKEVFEKIWFAVLDTENGLEESAYNRLYEIGEEIDPELVGKLSKQVDATDGYFYIPSSDDLDD